VAQHIHPHLTEGGRVVPSCTSHQAWSSPWFQAHAGALRDSGAAEGLVLEVLCIRSRSKEGMMGKERQPDAQMKLLTSLLCFLQCVTSCAR